LRRSAAIGGTWLQTPIHPAASLPLSNFWANSPFILPKKWNSCWIQVCCSNHPLQMNWSFNDYTFMLQITFTFIWFTSHVYHIPSTYIHPWHKQIWFFKYFIYIW
jgi:hypothetical protein